MKGNFQIIILIVFIITAVLGVLVFSGAIPLGNSNTPVAQGSVVMWGTVKSAIVFPLLDDFNRNNSTFVVKYVEKSTDTFDNDLLEALASGNGPDMFFITDDLAYKYSNKIYTIPYQSFPLNTFKNTFVGAGEVFLTSKGILAFPLTVDPLVMYYNRSMFDANQIANPPVSWDEVTSLVSILNKKNDQGLITKSAIALGQFSNISHAKDILSTILMQTGNKIVTEKDASFVSVLDNNVEKSSSVLKFYTDFANPLNSVYSWNKSFTNSQDAFSAENLALYFGLASELKSLINKNPNQNFMVAPIPQIKNSNFKLTGGHVMGIAITSFSKNFNTAFTAAGLMYSTDFSAKLATSLGIAPARRDLLKNVPADAYSPIFYTSAFFTKSWLDPLPKDTGNIFRGMVEKVLSGSLNTIDAVRDASSKMGLLLIK